MKIDNEKFNKSLESLKKASLDVSLKSAIKQQVLDTDLSQVFSANSSYVSKIKKTIAATAIVVFGFGSAAFASTDALPGDILYPFKTNIVEPIVLATKISAEAKAEYKLELDQKRLEEKVLVQEREGDVATVKIEVNQRSGDSKTGTSTGSVIDVDSTVDIKGEDVGVDLDIDGSIDVKVDDVKERIDETLNNTQEQVQDKVEDHLEDVVDPLDNAQVDVETEKEVKIGL